MNENNIPGFYLFDEDATFWRMMPEEKWGKVLNALFAKHRGEDVPDLSADPLAMACFIHCGQKIANTDENYLKRMRAKDISNKRSEAGKLGAAKTNGKKSAKSNAAQTHENADADGASGDDEEADDGAANSSANFSAKVGKRPINIKENINVDVDEEENINQTQNKNQDEKKEREKNVSGGQAAANSLSPSKEELIDFFVNDLGSDAETATKMYLHFASRGWQDAHGNALVDWRARAEMWRNDAEERKRAANAATGGNLGVYDEIRAEINARNDDAANKEAALRLLAQLERVENAFGMPAAQRFKKEQIEEVLKSIGRRCRENGAVQFEDIERFFDDVCAGKREIKFLTPQSLLKEFQDFTDLDDVIRMRWFALSASRQEAQQAAIEEQRQLFAEQEEERERIERQRSASRSATPTPLATLIQQAATPLRASTPAQAAQPAQASTPPQAAQPATPSTASTPPTSTPAQGKEAATSSQPDAGGALTPEEWQAVQYITGKMGKSKEVAGAFVFQSRRNPNLLMPNWRVRLGNEISFYERKAKDAPGKTFEEWIARE